MSSFPDFSFKGNISLFQAVGLVVVGYERKREGEREKKRGGPLVFSLARPLFFARAQLPTAWNRLRKYQPHRLLVHAEFSKKEKFHGIKLQKYGNIGRQTCQTLQTYSQLPLRRTPLGPALSVHLREVSVL